MPSSTSPSLTAGGKSAPSGRECGEGALRIGRTVRSDTDSAIAAFEAAGFVSLAVVEAHAVLAHAKEIVRHVDDGEGEIEIAKRIEAGRNTMIAGLCESPLTFQAITIFGAGDPKAMAGGISSALVTTVLGLCVAIPTVLLHTIVNSRAKRVVHILDEQAAGVIAEHTEAQLGNN